MLQSVLLDNMRAEQGVLLLERVVLGLEGLEDGDGTRTRGQLHLLGGRP